MNGKSGGERPESERNPGEAGRTLSPFIGTYRAVLGAILSDVTCRLRRRRRRAPAAWSEPFFCKICFGVCTLNGLLRALPQRSPFRLNNTTGAAACPDVRDAAPPGTASNSAGNSVHIIRPKCRRLTLQILGLMLHEIHHAVTGAGRVIPLACSGLEESIKLP